MPVYYYYTADDVHPNFMNRIEFWACIVVCVSATRVFTIHMI